MTDFSESSASSLSSSKNKGEERSLSSYMERLSTQIDQQECERKPGVSERQRRGQRRDTTTSQDGDIESGEEPACSRPSSAKKHQKQQRKKEEPNKSVGPKAAEAYSGRPTPPVDASEREQEKEKKAKKKGQPKQPEEERKGQGGLKSAADPRTPRPKPNHGKSGKAQHPVA